MKELYPMRGVITTVNTPFNEDLTINWSDLRRTAEAALEAGVSGFLAPCFASEIDELTNEERYRMVTELLACLLYTSILAALFVLYHKPNKNGL